MAENFRALGFILALAIPVLWLLRRQLTPAAMVPADFRLRAGLWLALTVALFVAHNFWLFVLIVSVAVLIVGGRDSNPLGLYFFLLLLAPPFQSPIPGFGGINYIIALDYLRLLSLILLLPYCLSLSRQGLGPRLFQFPADKYLAGYLLLQIAIQSTTTSATDAVRFVVSLGIDVCLPYYAFSRGLSDARKLKDALAAFTCGCAVLAAVALLENLKGWLLYGSLANVLNVDWGFGSYMLRNGALRASASAGHSIVLGFVLTVAVGLHLALRTSYRSGRAWLLVLLLFAAGIVATMSRGPWTGAAALMLTAVLFSPARGSSLGKLALAAIPAVPALFLTPAGEKLVSVLPFIGSVDAGSVDYRKQLFNVSWDILMLNPIFGSPNYMANGAMEQMRQGDGIIDMVNSYLGVAMYSGFVGLALFAGVFASSTVGLVRCVIARRNAWDDDARIGLALLATLAGVLVSLATLSSIVAVPVVYWCLAGTCAAYLGRVHAGSPVGPSDLADQHAAAAKALGPERASGYAARRG